MENCTESEQGLSNRGAAAALKPDVDGALKKCPDVSHVLVVKRTNQDVEWTEGRDVWWHDAVDSASADQTPETFDSEHPLHVMYTTGKSKGILHTTGGYMVGCTYTAPDVAEFGIKVTIVEPATCRLTSSAQSRWACRPLRVTGYEAIREMTDAHLAMPGTQLGDPARAASAIIAVAITG